MAMDTTTRDRQARRSERSKVDAYRRHLKVSFAVLAHRLGRSSKWVWDCISDRGLRPTKLSEVQQIRAALDELAKRSKGSD